MPWGVWVRGKGFGPYGEEEFDPEKRWHRATSWERMTKMGKELSFPTKEEEAEKFVQDMKFVEEMAGRGSPFEYEVREI